MKFTEEHKRKIGEANRVSLLGHIPYNKGKTKQEFPNMSHAGRKKGSVPWNKGKTHTQPANPGSFKKGQLAPNWNGLKKGHKTWNKGIPWSPEVRAKLSRAQLKRFENPTNHPNWQGGRSFEPYPISFNRKLKRYIADRDNHCCVECFAFEDELRYKLCKHHIDYDKNNCDERNIVCLCRTCHAKTNWSREYWQSHLKTIIDIIYEKER
jgi:hypothetical protein